MQSDGDVKRQEALDFLRMCSRAWMEGPSMACAFHPESEAFSVCPVCGRPLCKSCALAPDGHCPLCRSAMAKAGLLKKILSAFCQPVLWVFLCIAVAAGLYSLGIGNPSIEELGKMDAARVWHLQEAPKVLLAQGARERKRAKVLASQGSSEEAAKWYARASESYAKAAELWGNAPAAFAPALAAAETLSLSGAPSQALELAKRIKPPEAEADLMDFHFAFANIAAAAGDTALAQLQFQKAMKSAKVTNNSPMEGIITALTGDRNEATFAAKVRIVSGLSAKPGDVIRKCRQALAIKAGPDEEDFKPVILKQPADKDKDQDGDFQIERLQPKGGAK